MYMLDLLVGPVELSDEEARLRVGVASRGDHALGGNRRLAAVGVLGVEIGEDRPRERQDEAVRLAELGLLSEGESVALHERANEARTRIGTTSERVPVDVDAVEMWQAVNEANAGRH